MNNSIDVNRLMNEMGVEGDDLSPLDANDYLYISLMLYYKTGVIIDWSECDNEVLQKKSKLLPYIYNEIGGKFKTSENDGERTAKILNR